MLEYALVVALLSVVVIASISFVGAQGNDSYCAAARSIHYATVPAGEDGIPLPGDVPNACGYYDKHP